MKNKDIILRAEKIAIEIIFKWPMIVVFLAAVINLTIFF